MSKDITQSELVPRLRFPGFRDMPGWQTKPLSRVLEYERPDRYIVANTDYVQSGTPVLTANKSFILGYTEETEGIFEDVPVIIFDDFTTDKKYVDFPFKVKSSAIKILKIKDNDQLKIIYELMVGIRFDPTQHKRYYISQYQHIDIPLPKDKEQRKIADCLGSLDDLVAAEGRKLETLRNHKQGLMQQLFPREGESQPRLRFPKFQNSGDWDTQPFVSLYDFKPNNSYSRDQLNYVTGTVKNIHYGDIHTRFATHFRIKDEYVPYVNSEVLPETVSPAAICRPGDMIFADASEDLADVGKCIEIIDVGDERVVSGSHTILARPRSASVVVGFAGFLFKSRCIRNGIEKEAQGTKVMQISPKRLAKIDVIYPRNEAEQQSIATCLSALDIRIATQAEKLDTLRAHKRGLMQQLFPVSQAATEGRE